jgi:predicted ester cyclase
MTDEEVIRAYYAHFNARRFEDATALRAPDAPLEHAGWGATDEGTDRYQEFSLRWLRAFPDGEVRIERIDRLPNGWYEVHLMGEGTHSGDFDMGPMGTLRASHRKGRVRLRHLLQVCEGRITSSTLSFDTQEMIRQFQT